MLDNAAWEEAMAITLPSFSRTSTVEKEARALLSQFSPVNRLTTRQLAEKLWPFVGCTNHAARRRMLSTLLALAETTMADCAERGQAEQRRQYGRTVTARPWVWHSPPVKAPIECPKCGNRFDVV